MQNRKTTTSSNFKMIGLPFLQEWLLKILIILCALNKVAVAQTHGELRLSDEVGGGLQRLEIYEALDSGTWGGVCAQTWGVRESLVVCQELGFTYVGNWGKESEGVKTTTSIGNVRCEGFETAMAECQYDLFGVSRDCNDGLVTLKCVNTEPFPAGIVRLKNGESPSEGRVEVVLRFGDQKNIVYTICDEDWDLADADVVCKANRYHSATKAVRGSYFGESPSDRSSSDEHYDGILTSGVQCNTSYLELLDCPNAGWFPMSGCPSGKTAGAICQPFAETSRLTAKLSDGKSEYSGVVTVSVNDGPFGSICDGNKDWTFREADVVCRSLGYGYALNTSFTTTTLEPAVNNIRCDGEEESLSFCSRGETCTDRADLTPYVTCSGPVDNSTYPLEISYLGMKTDSGILRVFSDGRWGTVCNKGWTEENAEVACRQLGYNKSVESYLLPGKFGWGPIFLSDVNCKGTEQKLGDCDHSGWGQHDGCDHSMDVGITCSLASPTATVNALLIVLVVMAVLVA